MSSDRTPPRRRPPWQEGRTDTLGHILDTLFFRGIAVWLIMEFANELHTYEVIAVFFGLFFMPEVLRGPNSLPVQLITRLITRKDESP